jgi:hypothetical protein
MRGLWRVVVVLGCITGSVAGAADAPYTHDGFYLRLQAGGGGTSASNDFDTLSGASGALNLELGGAIAENLILYGKLFGTGTPGPDWSVDGEPLGTIDDELSLNFGALGLGLSYYFMPVNVYLSGAVSFTQLGFSDSDGADLGEVGRGVGLHLGLGKEWWVSEQWGLGVGAEFALSRVRDEFFDENWGAGSLLLLFSATFN